MASISLGYNKRVAIVYFSAALLIVSVGVRMVGSLMSEGGQELSTLDWVMIVGIALEFFVLTYYSSFMWSQPDEDAGGSAKLHGLLPADRVLAQEVHDLQQQYASLTQQSVLNLQSLKELTAQLHQNESRLHQFSSEFSAQTRGSQEQLQRFVSDVVLQLRNNEAALNMTTRELTVMEKTLKDFVEGKIKEQVQKEVGDILSAVVTQRMTSQHNRQP